MAEAPRAALDLGGLLSRRGRSHCTYVFDVAPGSPAAWARLGPWLSARLPAEVAALDDGRIAVRVDHERVDAQRGLALVLRGLAECGPSRGEPLPALTTALEPHRVAKRPAAAVSDAAREAGKTVTQWVIARLWTRLQRWDELRLIVSRDAKVGEGSELGNHFVPVDVSRDAMAAMLERSASEWKKLLHRLTEVAARRLAAAPAGTAAWQDTVTITSVGSLDHLAPTLAAHGITGMVMYPENVSYCSHVLTVYTLRGELHLVGSGHGSLLDVE